MLFTTLTAACSGETLGATWDEIDFEAKLWTIPAERMKAGAEHKVPLAGEVIALLKSLPRDPAGKNPHLFRGPRAKTLSNMAMLQCLRGIRSDGSRYMGVSRRLLDLGSGAGVVSPALTAPLAASPAYQPAPAFEQVQYDGNFRRGDRDNERRGRFERRGNSAYFNNQRGYRQPRAGYREYNGFWFPPAAFIAGAIIGGALNEGPRYQQRRPDRSSYRMSNDHVAWCSDRWRSYRVSDNSYQPTRGPRRVCTSPFG